MRRRFTSGRLAVALSAAALAVAVLGSTPLGEAALNAVPFAQNAGRVNGIKASRAPKAGQLLALGANRKFPASVVPEGPAGPRGPEGPAGPQGPPAASRFVVVNADGTIYAQRGVISVTVTETGTYNITWDRSLDACAVIVNVGGHRTGPDTWDPVQKGFGTVRTYGQVAEVRTLTDNGFSGGFQERPFGFHAAAYCPPG